MSEHYTDEDVKIASRAITRQNMPNASDKLVDLLVEQGEWDNAARWVLDAVAPAIAARTLRGLATEMDAPDWSHKDDWNVSVIYPNALRRRADEIEAS